MKNLVAVMILVAVVAAVGNTSASAEVFGPFCIATGSPLDLQFELFLTSVSRNIFTLNGFVVSNPTDLIYGTLRVQSSSAAIAFTGGAAGPSPFDGPTFWVAGSVNLANGSGLARCEVKSGVQCGPTGSSVTVTVLDRCP